MDRTVQTPKGEERTEKELTLWRHDSLIRLMEKLQDLDAAERNVNVVQNQTPVQLAETRLRNLLRNGRQQSPLKEAAGSVKGYMDAVITYGIATPSFLNRNLPYMRPIRGLEDREVGSSNRKGLKVDDILGIMESLTGLSVGAVSIAKIGPCELMGKDDPSGSIDVKKSPSGSIEAKKSPSGSIDAKKSPSGSIDVKKSPSGSIDAKKSPSGSGSTPYILHYSLAEGRVIECQNGFICLFCPTSCDSLANLRMHLEYNHSLFQFKFNTGETAGIIKVSLAPQEPKPNAVDDDDDRTEAERKAMYFFRQRKLASKVPTLFERIFYNLSLDLVKAVKGNKSAKQSKTGNRMERALLKDAVNDYADIEGGDKLILRVWNSHILGKGTPIDSPVLPIMVTFIDNYGKKIVDKNIYRNFIIFLTSFYDNGKLTLEELNQCSEQISQKKCFQDMARKFLAKM